MEVFPGNAIRIGDPVLLAASVTARGFAFVEQRHVGGCRACLHRGQFLGIVRLKAEMIESDCLGPIRNGEVDGGIVEHPLCVVGFDARGFGAEKLRVEGNALLQIGNVNVNVEAFHEGLRNQQRVLVPVAVVMPQA